MISPELSWILDINNVAIYLLACLAIASVIVVAREAIRSLRAPIDGEQNAH